MSMSCAFSCIAARCSNGGIGYKGDLPWPRIKYVFLSDGGFKYCVIFFRRDMKFLKEKSLKTEDPSMLALVPTEEVLKSVYVWN